MECPKDKLRFALNWGFSLCSMSALDGRTHYFGHDLESGSKTGLGNNKSVAVNMLYGMAVKRRRARDLAKAHC